MSYKKEEEKWIRKVGFDPPTSPIPPPSAPRISTSPPLRVSISPPPPIDTQILVPKPEISTPHPPSSIPITFEQVKDLVSSLSETFTSQFQNL